MKTKNFALAFALAVGLSGVASAQVISYSPRTGDVWVDSELGYYNDYGRRYRDPFVDDIVTSYGAPRYLVNELLTTRGWSAGDVYYACALAYSVRRSCSDVVSMYDQNRGQGWGVVAKRLGIKPGSAEFHALKGQMGKSRGRYDTYATSHRAAASGKGKATVDDGSPGNSGQAKGKKAKGKPVDAEDKDKGKENGKGKSKGY